MSNHTTFRKRVTIVTSEKSETSVDDHQSTGGIRSSRNRGGAVYRKKMSNVEGSSAIESSDRGATTTLSEKSYDSESDIDINYIEELERH